MHREHTIVSKLAAIVGTTAELLTELGFVYAFFPHRAQLLGGHRDAGTLTQLAGLHRSVPR